MPLDRAGVPGSEGVRRSHEGKMPSLPAIPPPLSDNADF